MEPNPYEPPKELPGALQENRQWVTTAVRFVAGVLALMALAFAVFFVWFAVMVKMTHHN